MNKKTLPKLLVSLGITFSLAVIFFLSAGSKPYQNLELKALDLRFNLRPNRAVHTPILHIDIDDQSIAQLGRWPWPRSYHAKLIETLSECGAKLVVMDVLFTEKLKDKPEDDAIFAHAVAQSGITYLPFYFPEDKLPPEPKLKGLLLKDITISSEDAAKKLKIDPGQLKDKLPLAKKYVLEEEVRKVLRKDPGINIEDALTAIEESNGWFIFPTEETFIRDNFEVQKLARIFVNKFGRDYAGQTWPYSLKPHQNLIPLTGEYMESVKGSGYINAEFDQDGVMRRMPLFMEYENKILPQVSVCALLDLLEVKNVDLQRNFIIFKQARIEGAARLKDIVIPVDRKGCMLINWAGPWAASFKHLPYYLVIRLQEVREQLHAQLSAAESNAAASEKDKALLEYAKNEEAGLKQKLENMVKGKICIVGLTATGTQDLGPTPIEENYPMVGAHSNLLNTLLTQSFIRKAGRPLNAFIFFITALIIGLCSLMRLWRSLILAICYGAGYFLATYLAFDRSGLWIDLVGPTGIVVFGFSAITSFRFFTEEREKLWIKNAFGHYLSEQVINELMDNPEKLKLGGEKRKISVIFSDVRGFTTFSESHQPEEVVAMLNEILTEQVKVVFKYNGTLDKFVGDELMAFFGAPGVLHENDHALVAVRTAVEIQGRMTELRRKWEEEKKDLLHIGIGINTGDMVVGNMGSLERMDYTVIGDNVNLGARLCSAAAGDELIISEATYELVAPHITAEKLEPIMVKGKAKPISIYRVTGMK